MLQSKSDSPGQCLGPVKTLWGEVVLCSPWMRFPEMRVFAGAFPRDDTGSTPGCRRGEREKTFESSEGPAMRDEIKSDGFVRLFIDKWEAAREDSARTHHHHCDVRSGVLSSGFAL